MVLYLIIEFFIVILNFLFSIFPVFETPLVLIENLPKIFKMIFSFNYYLPISEAFQMVLLLIPFTIGYKFIKILLRFFNVDLTI